MAATDEQTQSRSVVIAPAQSLACSAHVAGKEDSAVQLTMPYTCVTCSKRKVRCDKTTPICTSCRKGKLECVYQAPPPRRRKRWLSSAVNEKLARYERILHQHGLLPQDAETSPSTEDSPQEPIPLRGSEPSLSQTGRLLASEGKSRYIDSAQWHNFGDDDMQHVSDEDDEDDEDEVFNDVNGIFVSDPLTGALIAYQHALLHYHPTHAEAMSLWKTHIENVEPICKILHIPSTTKMVEMISQHPSTASKSDECVLFAMYHFAIFSMTENECATKFETSRVTLLRRYHFATRQALVNVSFLKTTEMAVLQALVLFLLSCRYFYDAHTYWILTGAALRIGQRMGLHRDGETMGLPPFDVQMRRRLFYQVLPLDGGASQMSGTSLTITSETWDTQQPLNVNDDQIWPGMTEAPEEQKGATEMIFCLARSSLGRAFAKSGRLMHGGDSGPLKDYNEIELLINEAEREVEERYIRYCDIVNPLHFLTISSARCAITAMRLLMLLPKVRNRTISDAESRVLFQFSQKIIDTDTATYAHASLSRFRWHVRPFFLWGSWDSLIFVVTSLRRSDLLSPEEIDAAWSRVEQVYNHHTELHESKRALYVAIGRITLKAWNANPPSISVPQPAFITTLRCQREGKREHHVEGRNADTANLEAKSNTASSMVPSHATGPGALLDSLSEGMDIDMGNAFDLDSADSRFWDRLMHDYQTQGAEQ